MPEVTRPDLAAMIAPLGHALMVAEQPILDRNGLSMWAYVVLLRLDDDPIYTQAALAKATRADKTRIIAILDDLQRRGLIRREPNPADRRVNMVSLTPEGRVLRDRTQREIQEQEEVLLANLPAADRRAFLRALQTLHDIVNQQE
ncbi:MULTISPECIES: MarR family winged helix-turn-helix transcriptional regulator [unclassified Nocardia]|uniref:MarR family winged helix-turn-helix transcriptional regulator n=1 Tax=unclassified Nocardia TaxID=2637762 RepID=UPI001CE4B03A|nr:MULTISPECIES: MarR family winged helix-turn-helix transcriptional regulator [unclassified Nocardia]